MAEFQSLEQISNEEDSLITSLNQWSTLDEQAKSTLLNKLLMIGLEGAHNWQILDSHEENIAILLINVLEVEVTNLHELPLGQSSSEDSILSNLLKVLLIFTREGEAKETSIIPNICALLRVTRVSEDGSPYSVLEQCLVTLIDKRGQDLRVMGLTCRLICHITGIAVLPNWDTDKTIVYPHFFSRITSNEKDKEAVKRIGDVTMYFSRCFKEHRIVPQALPSPNESPSSINDELAHYSWFVATVSGSFNYTHWHFNRVLDPSLSIVNSLADYVQNQSSFYKHYGTNSPLLMDMDVIESVYEYSNMLIDHLLEHGNNQSQPLSLSDSVLTRLFIQFDFTRLSIQILSVCSPSSQRLDEFIDRVLGLCVKWFEYCVFHVNGTLLDHQIKYIPVIKSLVINSFHTWTFATKIFQRWINHFNGISLLFRLLDWIRQRWMIPMTNAVELMDESKGTHDDALSILSTLLEVCFKMMQSQPFQHSEVIEQCVQQIFTGSKEGIEFIEIIMMLQTKKDDITYSQDRLLLGPFEWIIHNLNIFCERFKEFPLTIDRNVPKLCPIMIDILRLAFDYSDSNVLNQTCHFLSILIENQHIAKKLFDCNINTLIAELLIIHATDPDTYQMIAELCRIVGNFASLDEQTAVQLGEDGICEAIGLIAKKYHRYRKENDEDDIRLMCYRNVCFAISRLAQANDNSDHLQNVLVYLNDEDVPDDDDEDVPDDNEIDLDIIALEALLASHNEKEDEHDEEDNDEDYDEEDKDEEDEYEEDEEDEYAEDEEEYDDDDDIDGQESYSNAVYEG